VEPRKSMRNYAAGLAVVLLAVTTFRLWPLAGGLALVLLVGAAALLRQYQRWMNEPAPPHRAPLDRLVASQWILAGLVGLAAAAGVGISGVNSLAVTTPVRIGQALAGAAAIALCAVYLSSLVDWYYVLPRVGGLGGRAAPCEKPGEQWKYPTAIWLLHRGLATGIVVAAITAAPVYLAGTLGTASVKALLGVVAVVIGGGMAALNQKGLASITNAFNQPIYVGDTTLINRPGEAEGAPMLRRRAYTVDISVQGIKYQYLDGDDFRGPCFERKGHGPVPAGDDYRAIERVEGPMAKPCRDRCTGVNWYCRNNGEAYDH
jgi:hypothetical protein